MNSADANTIINDYLNVNNKYLNFIGNYLINVLRFFCPLELLFINVKYIFFIIYQLLITYFLIKSGKRINSSKIIMYALVLSFFMVSIVFEPDFGSFIRHETAIVLYYIELSFLAHGNLKEHK